MGLAQGQSRVFLIMKQPRLRFELDLRSYLGKICGKQEDLVSAFLFFCDGSGMSQLGVYESAR